MIGIELDPTHHTILRRIFLWCIPLIPPLDSAFLGTGDGFPVCLEDGLTDDTTFWIDGPIFGLLMLKFVQSAADLPTSLLMRSYWDILEFTDNTDPWCVPSLSQSFFSSIFSSHSQKNAFSRLHTQNPPYVHKRTW